MKTFASKSALPEQHGELELRELPGKLPKFLLIRRRWVIKILKNLDPDKASRPDGLPGRILRECAHELATPICMIAREMLQQGVWPETWKMHWIHPLFKRGAAHDASNYPGVRLTAIIANVVERCVGMVFFPFLDKGGAFGRSQWAFRPGCGCRDLVTIKFAKWIRDINSGKRIGLFLSDIKGAFDRVDSSTLALECAKVGLGETVCKFIGAWLAPRKAHVIVQGQRSEQIRIENQVYQGTVLGPPLLLVGWHAIFFECLLL